MATLVSVNIGRAAASRHTDTGVTGIDKRPSATPVELHDPGLGTGLSGVSGDAIGDPRSHGGTDQAVYAYAREDLDHWQAELGRPLSNGVFGENLTTAGLDVSGALVGERWQVGDECVLEVTSPRIPVTVLHRPAHGVTIALMFRALTTDKALQPQLAAEGDALPEPLRRRLVP